MTTTVHFNKATFVPTEQISKRTATSKTFTVGPGKYRALQSAVPIHSFNAEKQEWQEIDAQFKAVNRDRYQSVGSNLTTTCGSSGIEIMDNKGNKLSWKIEDAKEAKPEIIIPETKKEESEDHALTVFLQAERNAEGRIAYREIFPGVEMGCRTGFRFYDAFTFASPKAARDITFIMATGDLAAKQEKNGNIILTDKEGELVFIIASPTLRDAKENEGAVTVNLEKMDDGLRLTYAPDREFMEHAVYPVTLDPAVRTAQENSGIVDTYVRSGYTTDFSAADRLYATDYSTYGMRYSLLKVTQLPALGTSHFITSGKLYVRASVKPNGDTGVYCRDVFEPWDPSDVTYAEFPSYGENRIQDYILIKNEISSYGLYKAFDITAMAKQWYLGTNYGLVLTPPHDTAYRIAIFYSTEAAADFRPYFEIEYASLAGLEDYITYDSVSAGRAGSGSVSLVNGNMIFLHGDTSMNGARMPVSVSHVYNSCYADANPFYCGYGWQTNYHQTLRKEYLNQTVYYVYTDGDGTEHWFKPVWYGSTTEYEDESGLSMKLVVGTEKITIRDKGDNVMTYPLISETPTAANPVTGKVLISSIADAVGNTITITATGTKITSIEDGSRLSGGTPGRTTYFDYDSVTGMLVGIRTPWQSSTDCVRFSYTGSALTQIIYEDYNDNNGRISTYTYHTDSVTGHRLLTSAVGPEGIKAEFSYANTGAVDGLPHVVTESEVTDGTGQDAQTASHTRYHYSIRICIVEDVLTGKSLRYHFNDNGNAISVDDGLGYAVYANYDQSGENADAPINHPTTTSRIQRAVNNLLTDGLMLRGDNAWVKVGTGTLENSVASGYFGRGYKKFTVSNGNTLAARQTFTLESGKTYTLSGYVETEGPTCYLRVIAGSMTWESVHVVYAVDGNELTRVQVTFSVPAGVTSVSCDLVAEGTVSGTIARWDCAQLEIGEAANRINLIENSDFHGLSGTALPTPWTRDSSDSSYVSAEARADCEEPMPDAVEGNAVKILGRYDRNPKAYQTIRMTVNQGDHLTFGGWCAAFAKANNRSDYVYTSLQIWYSYENNTGWDTWTHLGTVEFNSQEGEWQFSCNEYVADRTFHWLRIAVHYNRQINYAYFSNLFLYKEQFGTNYVYDSKGNRKKRTGTSGAAGGATYDDYNNVLTSAAPGRTVSTTYNWGSTEAEKRKHLLQYSITPTGIKTSYQYDAYGNPTQTKIEDSTGSLSKYIQTNTTYTTAGTYVATQTDARGNTVTTTTDPNKGIVTKVTDPMGQEVNSQYDTLRRLTKTSTMLTTTQEVKSENTYDGTKGYLTSTKHNTSTSSNDDVVYNFGYDNLGRQTTVSVGNNVLSTTAYDAVKRTVESITFGNPSNPVGAIQYLYDSFSRVIGIRYDGAASNRFSYGYDAQGRVAYVIDHLRNVTIYTDYDLAGRPCQKTHITGTTHKYTGKLTYNGYDLPHQFREHVGANRTKYTTSFGYDNENRPTTLTYSNGMRVQYTYDKLGRLTNQNIGIANSSYIVGTNYYYLDNSGNSTTSLVSALSAHGVTLQYSYDDCGRITEVIDGGTSITYKYDAIGQLTRVNDPTDGTAGTTGTTWVYTYDLGGNIKTKKAYTYTTGSVSSLTPTESHTYTYGNTGWKDQLTAHDGVTIQYDAIGNPIDDGTWEYEWQHGKQLKQVKRKSNNEIISFEYNEDGLRTKKTSTVTGTTEYTLHGKNIVHMKKGNDEMHFFYGADNRPAIVVYNGTSYRYMYTLQGDVFGLVDESNNFVVWYRYDAWGKPLGVGGSLGNTLGRLQPFRYRGYVFDEETGLYYLRSRYYRAEWCRFVSADVMVKGNLYCYCDNLPIAFLDPWGNEALSAQMMEFVREEGANLALTDGPLPFADAIVAGIAAIAGIVYLVEQIDYHANSNKSYTTLQNDNSITEGISSTAGRYGNLQCVQAANAIKDFLLSNNLHGSIIEIRFPPSPGYVVSISHNNNTISENGRHFGVEYQGIVYCNVHPFGLPTEMWISDFDGVGPKEIFRFPF